MILSFSEDKFKHRILSGIKIHTIRTDRTERWKKGQLIHFWRGNPRNTKANEKPHEFHQLSCTSVQKIEFIWRTHNEGMANESKSVKVFIDDVDVTNNDEIIDALVIGDGFDDRKDFFNWFKEDFKGRLIHWTKKKY
jgi:hypothetical protein